jgi:hypothetical protein
MVRIILENYRVPYAEILRALGAYIDDAHLTNIRVLETDDGLILQGMVLEGAQAGERETYQLTIDDLKGLVQDARAKRGKRM